jgi:general secretion pathway protein N
MARHRVPERLPSATATPARRPWWLIGLGLAAVTVIAIATLPATLLRGQLARTGIDTPALSGSVWRGYAPGVTWRGVALGDLRWTVSPWTLLSGGIGGTLDLKRPDGSLNTKFRASLGGEIRLEDARATLPVELLSAFPTGVPRGWQGRLTAQIDELVVTDGWPAALRGTLDMDGLIAPPPRSTSIGSYRVVMPAPQPGTSNAGELTAEVKDKEGPFSFEGRFTLGRDRSFLLEGMLAPRGATPPALARSLELLGPADASGRRPVSVSGTL